MIALKVNLNGDGCWPDLENKTTLEADNLELALLDRGTHEGHPSVTLRLDIEHNRVILAQTTARLFCTAAKMIMARHPNLFDD